MNDHTDDDAWLASTFEQHRSHLRSVAFKMLGSVADADDAVQEAWIRLHRSDTSEVANLGGWLTTVLARVCLNMLRSRRTRGEQPFDDADPHVPDPIVGPPESAGDPEQQALLADSVGLALLVVLETLAPAERLAFVLHDMFAVPFDEIAPMIERTPAAARQMASRARRRVQGRAPAPDPDLADQRRVVDAFFAAARDGDFEALVQVLDPNVVLRSDGGTSRPRLTFVLNGVEEVTTQALATGRLYPFVRPATINGGAGAVVTPRGRPMVVMAFTVTGGRIVAIDVLADVDRLARLDLGAVLGPADAGSSESE